MIFIYSGFRCGGETENRHVVYPTGGMSAIYFDFIDFIIYVDYGKISGSLGLLA